MLKFNAEKCLAEVSKAETTDLLDRITAYRLGMEPQAIEIIEHELERRGVSGAEIAARGEECRRECTFDRNGVALPCSRCRRPAVVAVMGWHRLWGVLPLFPRRQHYCDQHRPGPNARQEQA
jgi:hypothetical protein